jgi:putative NADH-flavin reductase
MGEPGVALGVEVRHARSPPHLNTHSSYKGVAMNSPTLQHVSVLGGTGYGGTQVVKEALRRGHTVTVLSRSVPATPIDGVAYVQGVISDAAAIGRATAGADVIIGAISPRGTTLGTLVDGYGAVARRAAELGARLLVVGGFGSVRYEDGGPRVIESVDSLGLPADHVAEGKEMDRVRASLMDGAPDALDWVFVCPAAVFGAYTDPTPPRGTYRVGDDVAFFDDEGGSAIGPEDLALAILDEVETPTRHRALIHFAY